ncbi:MAG: hypothetical protein MUP70_13930 [Candidatus Aminicenantes bacterium]|nr:hypothetical protein [Candidatus Aminicenantes bacterium]
MRKYVSLLTLVAMMLVFCGLSLYAADISGTWIGTTEVPDFGEDELTVVLKKTESGYEGTFTDSAGMADNAELKDVVYEGTQLTFNFEIYNGMEYQTVSCALEVKDDTMTGSWETGDGSSGSIEMTKK